jgi:hypothetical protein
MGYNVVRSSKSFIRVITAEQRLVQKATEQKMVKIDDRISVALISHKII